MKVICGNNVSRRLRVRCMREQTPPSRFCQTYFSQVLGRAKAKWETTAKILGMRFADIEGGDFFANRFHIRIYICKSRISHEMMDIKIYLQQCLKQNQAPLVQAKFIVIAFLHFYFWQKLLRTISVRTSFFMEKSKFRVRPFLVQSFSNKHHTQKNLKNLAGNECTSCSR